MLDRLREEGGQSFASKGECLISKMSRSLSLFISLYKSLLCFAVALTKNETEISMKDSPGIDASSPLFLRSLPGSTLLLRNCPGGLRRSTRRLALALSGITNPSANSTWICMLLSDAKNALGYSTRPTREDAPKETRCAIAQTCLHQRGPHTTIFCERFAETSLGINRQPDGRPKALSKHRQGMFPRALGWK